MRILTTYLLPVVLALPLTGCEDRDAAPVLPDLVEVGSAYGEAVEGELLGNVLRVTVPMPEGFERGGSLWARSGPYFYLFTTATRDLLVAYPDLAAIEVSAVTDEGEEVARARLLRTTLNEVTWARAIAYASQAQTEGTESPRHVDRLVRWAEDHTEHEYNPTYVPR
jgi:hypothetical protein